jgi:hypothetical protein
MRRTLHIPIQDMNRFVAHLRDEGVERIVSFHQSGVDMVVTLERVESPRTSEEEAPHGTKP